MALLIRATDGTRARWARYLRWAGPALIGLGLLLATPAVASADPGSAGPSFQGGKSAPSGSKPESKLWYNDGFWWGNLYDTATDDFYIWRLDLPTGTWIRTNTVSDTRGDTRSDALWDGSKLYIANYKYSEGDTGTGSTQLRRFSYNAATDSYSLDAGFPTTIDTVRHEAFVIAKDSTGQLWATYERAGSIWVNRSTTSDSTWGTPFAIPGAVTVDSDDISSVIAFGGDRIGVLWSNQDTETDYFAVHLDSAGDTSWGPVETAYAGTEVADDHINLKTDASGRVYAAVKTSQSTSSLVLLVRQPNGTWSNHLVISDSDATRPIVLLDETNARIRVFYTVGLNGGPIVEKSSSMATISFSGTATVVMEDDVVNDLNNVTSTKQNVTAETGLVLLATNDTTRFYWWTEVLGTPPSDATPPTRTGQTVNGASLVLTYDEPLDGGSDPVGTAFDVTVNGSPRGVTSANADGTTVTLTLASPVVSSDSVTVAYTMPSSSPIRDVAGNDAASFSAVTVTNNTPPTGGGGTTTFTAVEDAQVKSSSATTNYGSATTMRLREESGGTTYQSYLKFNVSGLSGTVTSVKLRLFVTDAGPDSGHVHAVPSTWSESTLDWNNRPVIGGPELGSVGASTVGQYIEFDLGSSALGAGNGTYSFGIRTTSTNSVIFNTSEAATNRPQLVVTTSNPPSDTTPPVLTGQPTVNGTSLVLTYNEPLDGTSDPAGGDFTVSGSVSGAHAVNAANASGSIVTLTLDSPVVSTDNVTVAYTPGSNPIQDVAGNDAAGFAAVAVSNTTPPSDTTPPVLTGQPTVNGTSLVLTYNEPLDGTSDPAGGDFAVTVNGGARTVNAANASGSIVTLTLDSPVVSTDNVTVAYTPGSNPIQDVAGNDAAGFAAVAVSNTTPPSDTTPPVLTGQPTVNGTSLVLTYNEPLDGTSDPAGGDFAVTVNGGARTVNAANASGSIVTLTLDSPVVSTDNVTVAYTPGSNPIQDVAGNDAAGFAAVAVSNTTPPSDTTPPVLTGQPTVNGTSLVLTYNEPLDGTSDPAGGDFAVTVNGGARTVNAANASGSIVTLTLDSPVVSTDNVTVAYTPGSNPIQDVAGNDAAGFAAVAVSNTTPPSDTTPPVLTGQPTVNGTSLVLTYNEPLDGTSDPAGGDFAVTVNGGARTVNAANASGSIVTLTLDSPVVSTDNVTVAYTPGSNPIQDVAGNDAAGFAAVAVSNTTPPAGGSQTFTPFEDAQVKSTSANTNYGNDTTLRLREESGGTTYQSYIKFNVTGLTGPVTSVKLRLFVTDNSTNTTSVYTSSSTWAESTLTWTNRPTMGTTVLGSGIPSVTGAWVEIDLTASALAADNGTYSFGLRNSGTTSAIFSSSEAAAANRPQLVVTYGS